MADPSWVWPGDALTGEIAKLERRREFFRTRIEESEHRIRESELEIEVLDRAIAAMRTELAEKAGAK